MKKNMPFFLDRDTFLHLRLPFSFFLLPIFCFAISQTVSINTSNTILIFLALHFFIYPGSNIYNSFMDEDKGSIGGLKNPPPVTRKLYYASIIFDTIGILLCWLINFKMVLMMLIYIGISKLYSWKKIRLKKYGITGWLMVMFFQGGYTFLLVNASSENLFDLSWFSHQHIRGMVLASLLIGGFYPLTQIYQHAEDIERGDYTISFKLGIIGTFIFSGILFIASCLIAWNYFTSFYNLNQFVIFMACLVPVMAYYFYWLGNTIHNLMLADYDHTMRMTFISSTCMIVCWSIIFFLNH
jgi:1,4-dihydroxy-2-naphthoate octaprenyltransferase